MKLVQRGTETRVDWYKQGIIFENTDNSIENVVRGTRLRRHYILLKQQVPRWVSTSYKRKRVSRRDYSLKRYEINFPINSPSASKINSVLRSKICFILQKSILFVGFTSNTFWHIGKRWHVTTVSTIIPVRYRCRRQSTKMIIYEYVCAYA